MKRTLTLTFALATMVAIVAALLWFWQSGKSREDFVLHVMLDERKGIEPGDSVWLQGSEIGHVESVQLRGNRVEVEVLLSPEYGSALNRGTTFIVKSKGIFTSERRLEAHVLNPDAPLLENGETVEGVGSGLELALKKAIIKSTYFLQRVTSSKWFKEAVSSLEEVERKLEEIDWDEQSEALREGWEDVVHELEGLAEGAEESSSEHYQRIRRHVEELSRELEELGRSEQAQKLRRHLEELFEKLDAES